MFSKKGLGGLIFLAFGCLIVAYLLFRPDSLAFQTRGIAVREAYRNNISVTQVLMFTEQIETVRSVAKSGSVVKAFDQITQIVGSKEDTPELIALLRIYANAMHLSTRGDESLYTQTYLTILHKLHNRLDKTEGTTRRLEEIKPELNLGEMESGEFDAILANRNFP